MGYFTASRLEGVAANMETSRKATWKQHNYEAHIGLSELYKINADRGPD